MIEAKFGVLLTNVSDWCISPSISPAVSTLPQKPDLLWPIEIISALIMPLYLNCNLLQQHTTEKLHCHPTIMACNRITSTATSTPTTSTTTTLLLLLLLLLLPLLLLLLHYYYYYCYSHSHYFYYYYTTTTATTTTTPTTSTTTTLLLQAVC